MFGRCKICAEKDARISDLKEALNKFTALMSPPRSPMPLHASDVEVEADLLLSGKDEVLNPYTPEELKQMQDEADEASSLLAGTYDHRYRDDF